jgi:hypothetical protein
MRTFLTLVGSLCLALCLVSEPAYAFIIGGHSGHGWPNAAMDCFEGSHSKMTNIGGDPICDDAGVRLVIPLPISRRGPWIIRVRGSGNGIFTTVCDVIVSDLNNGAIQVESMTTTTGVRTTEELNPAQVVTVPSQGTLSVECKVPLAGSVQSVNWGIP